MNAHDADSPDDTALRSLVITDQRLEVQGALDPQVTYDIELNGSPVWSLRPAGDPESDRGVISEAWPKALQSYLRGRAEVVVRDHVSGRPLASGTHVFHGEPDLEVSVVDKHGNVLVLDKYGRLTRPLSAAGDAAQDNLMGQVEALLVCLRDRAGVPAFIAYGTLLGAVRNGQLIGHDNDVDIAYLSEHPYPVDVIREGYRVERVLLDEGWVVRRGSGTRLNVRLPQADGTMRFIDIFTAHWVDGTLYMPSDTGFPLGRDRILPLSEVELVGRLLPAPADPEALLAATYGANWRTPDPSFTYDTPRWLSRRLDGWFGGLRRHRKIWDAFYGGPGRKLTRKPSDFARWVTESYPSTRPLVDVGTGNGRDAKWFAEQGRKVTAFDYGVGVVARNANRIKNVDFMALNLCEIREVLALGTRLSHEEEPPDLYARFMLHALDEDGQMNLLRLARMTLRRGGHLFLEFRTTEDAKRPHHYPRKRPTNYVDPAAARSRIEAYGGVVVAMEQGTGLAPFHEEDPHVCRIVASWAR